MLAPIITALTFSVSPLLTGPPISEVSLNSFTTNTISPVPIPESFTLPSTPLLEVAMKEPERPKVLRCNGCNEYEQRTVSFLQEQGVKDRKAIAVVLGNIYQESTFIPNICEGGQRMPYQSCRRGGYGLIQFTSQDRYDGLGSHARRIGKDPSTLDAQLSYIVTEPQWKEIEPDLKTPGRSVESYMRSTYRWIGWGIHGARTSFAYDYLKRLEEVPAEIPALPPVIEAPTEASPS